jgi:hypothetical protein
MRSLLAVPVISLALAGAPQLAGAHVPLATQAQLYPITSAEAVHTLTTQLHEQVKSRLRPGYSGSSVCAGGEPEQQEINASTQLDRWRCTLELRGVDFPKPCRAEAYAFATSRPHYVRVKWIAESRFCRAQ